jgi:hypothetical protein
VPEIGCLVLNLASPLRPCLYHGGDDTPNVLSAHSPHSIKASYGDTSELRSSFAKLGRGGENHT